MQEHKISTVEVKFALKSFWLGAHYNGKFHHVFFRILYEKKRYIKLILTNLEIRQDHLTWSVANKSAS